jgi:hypothetical protein
LPRLREEPAPVSNWDAFYRQGPFVGSSGHYSPGPATRSPLATMVEPLSDTLASPWVFIRTSPICIGVETGSSTSFHSPHPPAGSTYERSLRARSPFTRPCRSFCCAYAELIRDQTPPDDFCNCLRRAGNQTIRLSFLAGTMASTTFLFSRTTSLIAEQ